MGQQLWEVSQGYVWFLLVSALLLSYAASPCLSQNAINRLLPVSFTLLVSYIPKMYGCSLSACIAIR